MNDSGNEIWRVVSIDGDNYEVSNKERFKTLNYKGTKKPKIYEKSEMVLSGDRPYIQVSLARGHKDFHRLVAMAFPETCGIMSGKCHVHHINGDKTDNRPENLRVLTITEHRKLHPHSEEELKAMSERSRGENNPFYGKRHTEETLEMIRKNRKGIPAWNKGMCMTDEQREKNRLGHIGVCCGDRNGMYGRHRSEREKEAIRKAKNKQVFQYSLSGEYIAVWPSIKQAQEELNIGHISDCCYGRAKSAGGYKWGFE